MLFSLFTHLSLSSDRAFKLTLGISGFIMCTENPKDRKLCWISWEIVLWFASFFNAVSNWLWTLYVDESSLLWCNQDRNFLDCGLSVFENNYVHHCLYNFILHSILLVLTYSTEYSPYKGALVLTYSTEYSPYKGVAGRCRSS